MCGAHYMRIWRHGNAEKPVRMPKASCKQGHEFTPENTYVTLDGKRRQCRQCGRDRAALYRTDEYWVARDYP